MACDIICFSLGRIGISTVWLHLSTVAYTVFLDE
jgi:hypothetical protein